MSSFNDYIKFSLDIEDQNIVFTDYFKKYINGKYHCVYQAELIQASCPFCHSTILKDNGHYTSNVRFILLLMLAIQLLSDLIYAMTALKDLWLNLALLINIVTSPTHLNVRS